jgi:hypothetical protein
MTHGGGQAVEVREWRWTESTAVPLRNRVLHALRIAAVAACVIVPLACSDSPAGPEFRTPVGAYALFSFDGKAPPVTLASDTNYLVVLSSASLALTADNKYMTTATVLETVLGHTSTYVDTTNGTWIQGATSALLVLTDRDDSSVVNATWSGAKITVTDTSEGVVSTVVYTRR